MANFKYSELSSWIIARIDDHTYNPGDKIPTEHSLAEMFSISRYTVRQAISFLIKQGYLYSVQGSGTYITDKAIRSANTYNHNNHNNTIAIVMSDVDKYIFPEIIKGASYYLSSEGYAINVMFTNGDFFQERQCLEQLIATNPAGILLEPANTGFLPYNDDLYAELAKRIPTILMHTHNSTFFDTLPLFDRIGEKKLVEHLIKMGHKNFGGFFLSNEQTGQARYLGMLDALREAALAPIPNAVFWRTRSEFDSFDSTSWPHMLGNSLDNITAMVCHNDDYARRFITYLQSIGKRVPEDIAVVGFDDCVDYSFNTQITSATHPKEEYGKNLARAIVHKINDPDTFSITDYEIRPRILIRQSSSYLRNDAKKEG